MPLSFGMRCTTAIAVGSTAGRVDADVVVVADARARATGRKGGKSATKGGLDQFSQKGSADLVVEFAQVFLREDQRAELLTLLVEELCRDPRAFG